MDAKDKRKLENQLLVMGLKGLSDPALIQQLADLVSNWHGDKHLFLQDLINQCDADKRYEMYHAIAPKLKFKALPLETYECRIAERAGELISQRRMRVEGQRPHPLEIGAEKYEKVPEALATAVIASLTCHKCRKRGQFVAGTPVTAMILARQTGWMRDMALNKETCPQCWMAHAKVS